MIFEASFEKGKSKKDPSKLKSKSFAEAVSMEAATHIKLKGSNKFEQISHELVIKRIADEEGKETAPEQIDYTQIKPNSKERYVCVIKEGEDLKEVEIDNTLYTHIVLMKKSPNGTFYKCENGKYVHKDEIQVPAYKKLEIGGKKTGLGNDGEFFVQQEVLKLKSNGNEIVLTNAMREDSKLVKRVGDKWFYLGNGAEEECEYLCNEDTRVYTKHVLIGGKIVETNHLSVDKDSKLVVDVAGFEPIEGKKEVELNSPFINVATVDYPDVRTTKVITRGAGGKDFDISFEPKRVTDNGKGEKRVYRFSEKEATADGGHGYRMFKDEQNYIVVQHWDGRVDVYFKDRSYITPEIQRNLTKLAGGDPEKITAYQANFDEYQEVVDGRIIYSFKSSRKINLFSRGKAFIDDDHSEEIEEVEEEIDYYPAGDRKINDLKWAQVDGRDQVDGYEMNGVKFSDIVWEGGEIKSCKIQYKNEEGEIVEEATNDIKTSRFKNLAIKCEQIDKLEDVKVNEDATISFKLGNYEFKDAIVGEDGKIGKCKLKIGDGEFQEIDIATESRFEQLRLSINTILVDQEIVPLVQSKLYEKKNGKYQLVADVVQDRPLLTQAEFDALNPAEKAKYCNMTEEEFNELSKDKDALAKVIYEQLGISQAKEIANLQEALEEQKKFRQKPFKTIVFDPKDPNKTHVLTDFENTYESASEFELDKDLIPDYIGKDKIDVKNGRIVIDSKNETDRVLNMTAFALGMCGYLFPFGLIVTVPLLPLAGVMAVVAPIRRAIKRYRLEHLDLDKVTKKMQKKAEKRCHKNVNKLEREYRRTLKSYKKLYSSAEYTAKAKEAREEFEFNCQKEIGKLQILGQGAIDCKFSLAGKTKLTRDNILGFIAAKNQQRNLVDGFKFKASMTKREYWKKRLTLNKSLEKYNDEMRFAGLPELDKKEYKELIKNQSRDITTTQSINKEYRRQKSRKHIQEGLDEYNAGLPEGQAIDKKDYKKILRQRRDEARATYGSIKDKIKAFKRTPEYMTAHGKERRKMVEDKRKELKKASLATIEQVTFNERFDKKGNSVARETEKDVLSYVKYSTDRLDTVEDDKKHKHRKCDKNFHTKKYSPDIEETASIADATCPVLYSDKERRCAYDAVVGQRVLEGVETTRQVVAQRVETMHTQIKSSNYEQLYQLEVVAKQQEAETKQANIDVLHQIRDAKYRELNESTAQAKEEEVRQTIISTVKVKKQLEQRKAEQAEVYRRQVEQWAKADYVKAHNAEFKQFCRNCRTTDGRLAVELFVNSKLQSTRRVDVRAELDVYRVQNNVEENIRAEVFCEQSSEKANFKEWVESERKRGVAIDFNSERTRCAYYAHCLRTRPRIRMDNFKHYSADECRQKAAQRMEAGTLVTSDKKQEQLETITTVTNEALRTMEEKRQQKYKKEQEEKKRQRKDREKSLKDKYEAHKADKAEKGYAPAPSRDQSMTK